MVAGWIINQCKDPSMRDSKFTHHAIPQEDSDEPDDDMEKHVQTSPLFQDRKEEQNEEGRPFQSYNGIDNSHSSPTFSYEDGRNGVISMLLRVWGFLLVAVVVTALFFLQYTSYDSDKPMKNQNDHLPIPDVEVGVGDVLLDYEPAEKHQRGYQHTEVDNPFHVSSSDGSYGGAFQPLLKDVYSNESDRNALFNDLVVGYTQYPNIYNNVSNILSEKIVKRSCLHSFVSSLSSKYI